MEILNLKPALKEIIWGGTRLHTSFHMPLQGENIAEAWLLSCHKDGACTVENGADAGLTLAEAVAKHGAGCLGSNCAGSQAFPLLIKLIDARERLSIQVHPGNAYAQQHENDSGKTEAWYVLDCDEGAELIYGFNRTLSREECRTAIENGTLLELCCHVPVKPGDVAFIPSGTLHAIGGGILLAEVQQSSNVTYRVFDYNRKGKDGNPRELHIDKALDVLNLQKTSADFSAQGEPVQEDGYRRQLLTSCSYFSMTRLTVAEHAERTADESSFVSLLVLDGEGTLRASTQAIALQKGSSLFIPAGSGRFTIQGNLTIIETRV